MENISQLVESSLARHGVTANFDHFRLQWSNWFRCESSFSVLLAPAKPGIFALGEEIVPPRESVELRASSPVGKRMLALFQISEADDLGMALGRLFLPGNPLRERLAAERCFARYAVIEDPIQRQTASALLRRWIQESAETASGISGQQDPCGADTLVRESVGSDTAETLGQAPARESLHSGTASTAGQGLSRESVSKSEPSTSFAWGMEVQDREVSELKLRQPLPSGF
jgi:hypothetical protein